MLALVAWDETRAAGRLTLRRAPAGGRIVRECAACRGIGAGRPGRGIPAQHPGDRDRDAGDDEHRCGLVELLAGFRCRRGRRPLRADRAARSSSARTATAMRESGSPSAIASAALTAALPSVERVSSSCHISTGRASRALAAVPYRARHLAGVSGGPRRAGPSSHAVPSTSPAAILYSSGTTGCRSASCTAAGGTLLQLLKEHVLHVDIQRHDRVFYYTTCGWMMWNWLVTALATGAAIGALRWRRVPAGATRRPVGSGGRRRCDRLRHEREVSGAG